MSRAFGWFGFAVLVAFAAFGVATAARRAADALRPARPVTDTWGVVAARTPTVVRFKLPPAVEEEFYRASRGEPSRGIRVVFALASRPRDPGTKLMVHVGANGLSRDGHVETFAPGRGDTERTTVLLNDALRRFHGGWKVWPWNRNSGDFYVTFRCVTPNPRTIPPVERWTLDSDDEHEAQIQSAYLELAGERKVSE